MADLTKTFPGLAALGDDPLLGAIAIMQDCARQDDCGTYLEHLALVAEFAGQGVAPMIEMLAEIAGVRPAPAGPGCPGSLVLLGYHSELQSLCFLQECASSGEARAAGGPRGSGLALLGEHPELPNLSLLQSRQTPEPDKRYEHLELMGSSADRPGLGMLHASAGDAHCGRVAALPAAAPAAEPSALSADVMQGPAGHALRQREEELRRREEQLAERERQMAAREIAVSEAEAASPKRLPASPHKTPQKQAAAEAGCFIDDDDLRELFGTYDRNGNGYVSKAEFKNEYRQFEDYGLPLTDRQLEAIFAQFGGEDDRLSYEEFSILMLQRAKI